MLPYPDDWKPETEATDEKATKLYEDLSADASEVHVSCRFTGGGKLKAVWGFEAGRAFVFVDNSAGATYCASCSEDEARQLFQGLVTWLIRSQSFIDSSPHSGEHFTCTKDLDDVRAEIANTFRVETEFSV